ncbi:elongation factor G [Microbaculum marinisediminis]|uniref:Elongation factor G n=1 Tax=Microbaculum marinisediminis TaxID=2931392 RepID=A0AAW5R3P6_9HYPH|nr:elongation factor G [Microbaculum sp. A6E488]MCT8974880.1 elongation factor G [Microbaculum sp. A6E488]
MPELNGRAVGAARCIALVGPYLSGKTTLLESILARTGAISRQGRVSDGNTVGDASPEARAHGMSVEVNVATTEFMGDTYTFVDCPGSIEFLHEARNVVPAVDMAIVVAEADEKKVPALQLILKELEDLGIPRLIFLNKIDKAEGNVRDVLAWLQPASAQPIVLRQLPIWENDIVTGFVDLALERAFVYREHAPSEVIEMNDAAKAEEVDARFSMLEKLADYDDELMEQLLSDVEPPRDRVFDDLTTELRESQIVPLLTGSAEHGNGILRLMKALRHEAPTVQQTVERLGLGGGTSAVAQILKTFHTPHGGKLSVARVLRGTLSDGDTVCGAKGEEERIGGLFTLKGQDASKAGQATTGDTVGLGRLEGIATGETISTEKGVAQLVSVAPPAPVLGKAIAAKERKDEVKLTSAVQKIMDEDPSLSLSHNQEAGEMVLHGQGEMHLRVAMERLTGKFAIDVETHEPRVGYKETIRKSVSQRGRHKKQSGGHGQFGDVVLDIKPLPRGAGFEFTDSITGGVVPKQYIPSVESGVRDYLAHGPLGFPVVDVAVNLSDGSYHTVDSSDMAFRTAGRIGMSEGLPQCSPVLLEPVMHVEIAVPADATSKVNTIVSQRRGQILGFDARPGWTGWDVVQAQMPEAEMRDLIVELRSATAGVGSYVYRFDHLAELTGKLADQVIESHRKEAA